MVALHQLQEPLRVWPHPALDQPPARMAQAAYRTADRQLRSCRRLLHSHLHEFVRPASQLWPRRRHDPLLHQLAPHLVQHRHAQAVRSVVIRQRHTLVLGFLHPLQEALLPQRQLSSRLIAHHHALGMRPIAAPRSIELSDHGRKNGDAGGLTVIRCTESALNNAYSEACQLCAPTSY
jgi:hypothetical protein